MSRTSHDRETFYRRKVEEGVDYTALFAGMVETMAVANKDLERLTETDTEDLKKLAQAYREYEDERIAILLGEDE